MAQHAGNGAPQARPLRAVLDEFSTCMAAADHAQGTRQPAESAAAAERLQKLLLEILQFAEAPTVNKRAIQSAMHMVDTVLSKLASVHRIPAAWFLRVTQQVVLVLLVHSYDAELHRVITQQLCGVITRLAHADPSAFSNICDGALAGVLDCREVMRLMCKPGALTAGTTVAVTLFEAAHAAAGIASPSVARLNSVQQCEALQTTLLELMAHCFRSAPCQLLAAAHGMHASLAPLTELVAFGGPAVQEAALSAAAAALAAGLPGHEGVPAASLLPALLGILAERTSLLPGGSDDSDAACSNGCKRAPLSESTVAVAADGSVGASVSRSAALSDMAHAKQPGSGDLEAWQRHLLHLLRRCVEAAAQQGSLTDVAASLVVGLSRAAVGAREGSIFQAQLAHSLADVIFIFPHLLDMCSECVALLPISGAVSGAVARLMCTAQLPSAWSYSAEPMQPASVSAPAMQSAEAEAPARKKRRVSGRRTASPWHTAVESTAGAPEGTGSLCGVCVSAFFTAVLQAVKGESAWGWSELQCLAALRTVLASCRLPAAQQWLTQLGPAVTRWALWGVHMSVSGTNESAAAGAASLGILECFAAACTRTAQAGNPDNPVAALSSAAVSFAALRLTAPQLRVLLKLPWTSHEALGLEVHRRQAAMVCSLRTGLAVAVLANGSGGDNTTPAAASNGSSTPGSASLACGLGADVVDHMLSLAVASSTAEVQSVAVALLPALKAALAQCAGGATAQSQATCQQQAVQALVEAAGSRHPAVRLAAATASGRCLTGELLGGLFLRDLAQIASTGEAAGGGAERFWCWGSDDHLPSTPPPAACNISFKDVAALAGPLLQDETEHSIQGAMATSLMRCFAAASEEALSAGIHARQLLQLCLRLACRGTSKSALLWAHLWAHMHIMASPRLMATVCPPPAGQSAVASENELAFLRLIKASAAEEPTREEGKASLKALAAAGAHMTTPSATAELVGMLVEGLRSSESGTRTVAAGLLEALTELRGVALYDVVMDLPALQEQLGALCVESQDVLDQVAELMGVNGVVLMRRLLPAALLPVLRQGDPAALRAACVRALMTEQELLRDYGHFVTAELLWEDAREELGRVAQLVEPLMQHSWQEFLNQHVQALLVEILHSAAQAPDWEADSGALPEALLARTQRVLTYLAVDELNHDDAAELLAGQDYTTKTLKMYADDLIDRQKGALPPDPGADRDIMRAVALLLRLTGKHVSRFVPQMMVVLTVGVWEHQPEGVERQALAGWLAFVDVLLLHAPSYLSSVLHQVVVAMLLPLSQAGPVAAAAAAVVEDIVRRCGTKFQAEVKQLPPLPAGVPELAGARAALERVRGQQTNEEAVTLLQQALASPSLLVRSATLKELQVFLQANRTWLLGVLTRTAAGGTDAAAGAVPAPQDQLLPSLLASLLRCIAPEAGLHMPERAQQAAAECLGLLGAWDPARMPPNLDSPEDMIVDDKILLGRLIKRHLARILRTAPHPNALDAACLSLQTLLRRYGSSPDFKPHPGGDPPKAPPAHQNILFRSLADVQAVVQPYLDSKFVMGGVEEASHPGVIFASRRDLPFRKWLCQWMRHLISQATGPRVRLFDACIPILRVDIPVSQFLLPYTVHAHLASGPPGAVEGVKAEMEAVLRGSKDCADGELCVQAVFALLDTLRKWLTTQQHQALVSSSGSTTSAPGGKDDGEPVLNRMKELLDGISQELLARAARHVGAHARALMHYETHVRAKHGGGLNIAALACTTYEDHEVAFLQEVYGGLEEPDGLAGLVRLRAGGPCPADTRLAAEKAGAWSEALSLHEQVLQNDASAGASASTGSAATQSDGVIDLTGDPAAANPSAAATAPAPVSGPGCDRGSSPTEEVVASGGGLTGSQRGYLRCLLEMGHLQSLLTQVAGWSLQAPDAVRAQLAASGVAAAWRLGQWAPLRVHLATCRAGYRQLSPDDRWEVQVGRLLAGVEARDEAAVAGALQAARGEMMPPLAAGSTESYARAHPHLTRLHMLQELQDAAALLQKDPSPGVNAWALHLQWGARLDVMQASVPARLPLLALRRRIAAIAGLPAQAGAAWLQQARLCRAAGHFEAAGVAALKAVDAGVPEAPLEHAKLLWAMDKPHRAIVDMEQVIARHQEVSGAAGASASHLGFPTGVARQRHEAKARTLLACWIADTGQGFQEDVEKLFTRSKQLAPQWEKPHFCLARYLDRLMGDARKRQTAAQAKPHQERRGDRNLGKTKSELKWGKDAPHIQQLPLVLRSYAESIKLGYRHIYQSLPRLLTLWYDFGTQLQSMTPQAQAALSGEAAAVSKEMARLAGELPAYVWLVALPQLISRATHCHARTSEATRKIITSVFGHYPDQAMWALACMCRSEVDSRRAAGAEIVAAAKKQAQSSERRKLFSDFQHLCNHLIKLTDYKPGGKHARNPPHISLRQEGFSHLVRAFPLSVMVPVQATLSPTLPPARGAKNHQPFGHLVSMEGVEDHVDIMSSLQAPKKVSFVGSDGHKYLFLAKPQDDLRKDSRMMDMLGVLNRLLAKQPASRRRSLGVRRFAVTPLTEDAGLIEWVNGVEPLRHVVRRTHPGGPQADRQMGPTIKAMYDRWPKDKTRAVLLDKVLAMVPPTMHRWFLARWPEAGAWHAARLAFTRTAAVMSMVGHITGLGDRHGENLLVHGGTGEVMHVDFSCLFDRGLTLNEPERVPFRLTQNLIDCFGVSGHEGAFRRCCEATLQVLRGGQETLLCIFDAFLHDPLVDWKMATSKKPPPPAPGDDGRSTAATATGRASGSKSTRGSAEEENPHAKDALETITGRLRGTLIGVMSAPSLPLSVEGQAHRLISEAASKENLGMMYIWWMPWV